MENKWHDIPGFEGKYQVNCFTEQVKSLKRPLKNGHKMTKDKLLSWHKKGIAMKNNSNQLVWVTFEDLKNHFYPKDKTKSYWVMPITESGQVQSLCGKLGLDLQSLKRGSRNKKEERPKLQAIYYYLTNDLKFSTPKVGKYFGRDHSSVIWNRDNFKEAITVYDDVKQYYELLKKD